MRLRDKFRHCVFDAAKLVSATTLLPQALFPFQGKSPVLLQIGAFGFLDVSFLQPDAVVASCKYDLANTPLFVGNGFMKARYS